MKLLKQIVFIICVVILGIIIGLVVRPEQGEDSTPAELYGGVVPHHDLIPKEIGRFWEELAVRVQPEAVVLVGPDHYDAGRSSVSIANHQSALTEQVTLYEPLIEQLQEHAAVTSDNQTIREDHSIQIHLTFIQKYLPDTEIVPLIFRADAEQSDVIDIAEIIRTAQGSPVAVVASVDFSHYLTHEQATERDIETSAAIQEFDYQKLQTFGPDNIDSDQSVVLVSEAVCPTHDCSWETLFYGNSSEYSGNPAITTSYYSLFVH